jgi:8-oxo-dGTP pyrophosphatase MutT (NUDIX family)
MGKKPAPWKSLSSEEVLSTPWMTVVHDQFELPTGTRGNYFYLHTRGSSLIVPVNDEGRIVLVRQYRYLIKEISLELPCGGVKKDQNESDAARAELREETGYESRKMKKVGRFIPYNGLSDEFCTVFVASGLYPANSFEPDVTEQIEVVTAAPGEVDTMISRGRLTDGMSIAGWTLARSHLK